MNGNEAALNMREKLTNLKGKSKAQYPVQNILLTGDNIIGHSRSNNFIKDDNESECLFDRIMSKPIQMK